MDNQSYLNQAYATQPIQPGQQPVAPATPATTPAPAADDNKKAKRNHLILIIVLIVVSLLAATFIGLFVWMYISWNDTKTNVDGKISEAVAIAVHDEQEKLETEFAEKEKYPFKTFAGPTDYGAMAFEYPKTWSVYVEQDASSGGDFTAYLHPDIVNVVNAKSLYALRVTIKNDLTEDVLKTYQRAVDKGTMKASLVTINGANANLYEGILSNSTKYEGLVAVFKIRDKTAIIQTDALLFRDDYMRILESIRFNV